MPTKTVFLMPFVLFRSARWRFTCCFLLRRYSWCGRVVVPTVSKIPAFSYLLSAASKTKMDQTNSHSTMKCLMMSPSRGSSSLSPRSPMDFIASSAAFLQCSLARAKPPHSKRRRRTHKAVTFAEEALLYPTTVSEEEAVSMWYSREELEVFRVDKRNLVKVLKRNDFDVKLVSRHFCLRGLEPYFSLDANRSAKCARDSAMHAVFCEQDRQHAAGLFEPETLRKVVMQATESSRQIALELAATDAVEARAIHDSFVLEQLAIRADKGLSLGTRRGVAKTPSLTQQEATNLAWALQQRQN